MCLMLLNILNLFIERIEHYIPADASALFVSLDVFTCVLLALYVCAYMSIVNI